MDRFENDSNGVLADTAPLFASNLLALFYMLRKNFKPRQAPVQPTGNSLRTEEK